MALSLDTDVISRDIFGLAYASADAGKQAQITAAVAAAKAKVSQYAQHVDFGDGTDGPSAWDNWGELEAEVILARSHRVERVRELREQAKEAMRAAMDSFASRAYNASASFGASMTPLAVRQHIAAAAMRSDRPLPLDPITIDNAIHSVVNEVWNQTGWHFRRRDVTMTIASNGAVTFDLDSGEYFDSFATRALYYTDCSSVLEHVNADQMSEAKSQTSASSGRPRWIRVIDKGSTKAYTLYPAPDQEYTLRAEVFIVGPEVPDDSSSTEWLDKFPAEFKTIIRDLATARVLNQDASPVNERLSALMPRFADVNGYLESRSAPRDVYNDIDAILPYSGDGYIGGSI